MGLFSRKKSEPEIKGIDQKQTTIKAADIVSLLDAELPSYLQYGFSLGASNTAYNSDTLLTFYETVSQVNSLINYIAENGAKLEIGHYRYQSNGKKKLLGQTELLSTVDKIDFEDALKQLLIHGNLHFRKGTTPGFEYPTKYTVEASNLIYVIPQYSIDQYGRPDQSRDVLENPVKMFKKRIENGILKNIQLEEMLHIKNANPNKTGRNYYYGASKLYAATRTISILANVYDTINTILTAKGALGFISRNAKQGEIDPLMWGDQKEDIEKKLNEGYGTVGNRRAIMATLADLKWNRMDSPINEFMPIELTSQEFAYLCNQFFCPDILFNSKDGRTYNNYIEAQKVFYTNCLAPAMSLILSEISKDAKINLKNEWLEVDWSNVEALQLDKKAHAETKTAEINYLGAMLEKKLLTKNQVLESMEFPRVNMPEFDEYEKPKPEPTEPTEPNNNDQNTDEDGSEQE